MAPILPPSTPQQLLRIVPLSEIEEVVSSSSFAADLVDAIRDGFLRQDRFYMAPIQTLGCPPTSLPFSSAITNDSAYCAQTCVKTGYFEGNEHYVIKVASGGHPFPANSGLMQVYSQSTGRLEALLLDEGVLTELRTAAVGALAFRLFAPKRVRCVGIVGCGVQARYQLRMLGQVLNSNNKAKGTGGDCWNACVYGRNSAQAKTYADEMAESGWSVSMANSPNELLDTCDAIITTTSAREALLSLPPGSSRPTRAKLLVCIGSDAPGKSEVDDAILEAADLRVADSVSQSRERGEFQSLPCDLPIVSLRDALLDPMHQRRRSAKGSDDGALDVDDRLVVFDSSGLALQDCVIAAMIYQAVLQRAST
jgi:ornithine cyclodeaminase/alanine dehydrogenase-like protein (mu-crystallin family)